jgi:hypothetical protein
MHHEQQRISGYLKKFISEQPGNVRDPNSIKRRVLEIVNDFEGCDWLPDAFKKELDDSAISISESGDVTVKGDNVFQAIADLLEAYISRIKLGARGVYSVKTAGEYLGVQSVTMDKYLYGDAHRQPVLRGTRLGREILFFRDELDDFKGRKRSPGRPRKDQTGSPD